jgi:hypothetical protein
MVLDEVVNNQGDDDGADYWQIQANATKTCKLALNCLHRENIETINLKNTLST